MIWTLCRLLYTHVRNAQYSRGKSSCDERQRTAQKKATNTNTTSSYRQVTVGQCVVNISPGWTWPQPYSMILRWHVNLVQPPYVAMKIRHQVRGSLPPHVPARNNSNLAVTTFSNLYNAWNILGGYGRDCARWAKLLLLKRVIGWV